MPEFVIHHQEKIDYILGLAKDLNYTACAAGSCIYLPDGYEPSDIDIYVSSSNKTEFKDFYEQLLCTDDFEAYEKKSDAPSYGYANQVTGCKYLKLEGTEINILGLKPSIAKQFFTSDVIRTFDYGVTQIGYDLENIHTWTEEQEEDHKNKTLTLLNVPSEYHLKKMGERLAKMQKRFPDYKVVIKEDFYKKKEVKVSKVTKSPLDEYLEQNRVRFNDHRAAIDVHHRPAPPPIQQGQEVEWDFFHQQWHVRDLGPNPVPGIIEIQPREWEAQVAIREDQQVDHENGRFVDGEF